MQSSTAILVAVGVFFAVVALVLAVLWAVQTSRFSRLYDSVAASISNELFCVEDEGPCRLRAVDDLPAPTEVNSAFDYGTARYCADLIARVSLLFRNNYKATELVMPPGMVNLKTLYYNGNIIGFIGERNGVLYAAFRGTSTSEEWRQDFEFGQNDFLVEKGLKQQTPFSLDLDCHRGFMNVFAAVQPAMDAVLQKGKTLVCTGHSLGSALATLSCLQYQDDMEVVGYVFGSPRVCEALPTAGMKAFFRVVNDADPINAVPLSVMWNLSDKNAPYLYQHGGQMMWFNKNWQSIEGNHLMPIYIEAIEGRSLAAF